MTAVKQHARCTYRDVENRPLLYHPAAVQPNRRPHFPNKLRFPGCSIERSAKTRSMLGLRQTKAGSVGSSCCPGLFRLVPALRHPTPPHRVPRAGEPPPVVSARPNFGSHSEKKNSWGHGGGKEGHAARPAPSLSELPAFRRRSESGYISSGATAISVRAARPSAAHGRRRPLSALSSCPTATSPDVYDWHSASKVGRRSR